MLNTLNYLLIYFILFATNIFILYMQCECMYRFFMLKITINFALMSGPFVDLSASVRVCVFRLLNEYKMPFWMSV